MFMIKRIAADKLKQLSLKFPVVAVVGPRQSGKTTLVRSVFAGKRYVSLEDPDVREFALNDPRKFLDINGPGTIIDEIQRVPDLFSYIQTIVDKRNAVGDFILTGSQNFLLQEKVSQTLAVRVAYLTLLPLVCRNFILPNIGCHPHGIMFSKGFLSVISVHLRIV